MPHTRFAQQCDRLSQTVDKDLFDRLVWERTEAPVLAELVALAQAALHGRDEFELAEEGATSTIKRFVLKVHSNRVAGLAMQLHAGQAQLTIEPIERSPYQVAPGPVLSVPYAGIDAAWMAASFDALFARITR